MFILMVHYFSLSWFNLIVKTKISIKINNSASLIIFFNEQIFSKKFYIYMFKNIKWQIKQNLLKN